MTPVERIAIEQAQSFETAVLLLIELGVSTERMGRATVHAFAIAPETRLAVDGQDVWRHWWEPVDEDGYVWQPRSVWLRHPGTFA